jgi:hypothetical protein
MQKYCWTRKSEGGAFFHAAHICCGFLGSKECDLVGPPSGRRKIAIKFRDIFLTMPGKFIFIGTAMGSAYNRILFIDE